MRGAAVPAWPGVHRGAPARGAERRQWRGVRASRAASDRRGPRWIERGVLAAFASGMLLSGASAARAVQAERMSPTPIEKPLATAFAASSAP